MVIVDSPGIGESHIMDGIVAQYLPEALHSFRSSTVQTLGESKKTESVLKLNKSSEAIIICTMRIFTERKAFCLCPRSCNALPLTAGGTAVLIYFGE